MFFSSLSPSSSLNSLTSSSATSLYVVVIFASTCRQTRRLNWRRPWFFLSLSFNSRLLLDGVVNTAEPLGRAAFPEAAPLPAAGGGEWAASSSDAGECLPFLLRAALPFRSQLFIGVARSAATLHTPTSPSAAATLHLLVEHTARERACIILIVPTIRQQKKADARHTAVSLTRASSHHRGDFAGFAAASRQQHVRECPGPRRGT
jgi:hypothetical protein